MNNGFTKLIQENGWMVTITLWVMGVVFASFNIYFMYKLAPLVQNDVIILSKVEALEKTTEANVPVLSDLKVLSEKVVNIERNVDKINTRVETIYVTLIGGGLR